MTDTETAPKTKHETWLDWQPADAPALVADEVLTREELCELINTWAHENNMEIADVSPGDIRFWELEEIIPRGVRKWHDGAIRSIYPYWFIPLLSRIRILQAQGLTLSQIKRRVRAHANVLTGSGSDDRAVQLRERFWEWTGPYEHWNKNLYEGITAEDWHNLEEIRSKYTRPNFGQIPDPGHIGLIGDMGRNLRSLAKLVDEFTGVPTVEITISFIDEEGVTTDFSMPLSKEAE